MTKSFSWGSVHNVRICGKICSFWENHRDEWAVAIIYLILATLEKLLSEDLARSHIRHKHKNVKSVCFFWCFNIWRIYLYFDVWMGIGNMLLCHMKWILAWEEKWFSAFVFAALKSESTDKANEDSCCFFMQMLFLGAPSMYKMVY